jgi:hypothetical protein
MNRRSNLAGSISPSQFWIVVNALDLIEAKNELEHGQFNDWVVRELRFGTRKDGSGEADLRKAEMLMFLARIKGDFKLVSGTPFCPLP